MHFLFIPLLIYSGLVAQSTLVPMLPAEIHPCVPALVLLGIGLTTPPSMAIAWSGVMGFALDALTSGRMGIQMGLAALIAWWLQSVRKTWLMRSPVTLGCVAAALAIGWRGLVGVIQAACESRWERVPAAWQTAGPEGLTTALLMCSVTLVVRGLSGGQRAVPPVRADSW